MNLMRTLINLILPLYCRVCNRALPSSNSTEICDDCWSEVQVVTSTECIKCNNTFRIESLDDDGWTCTQCKEHSVNVNYLSSYGLFEGVLREAIHLFKYRRNIHIGEKLAGFTLEAFDKKFLPKHFDYIIPVPLHKSRLRWREFNQSAFLAKKIGSRLNIPVVFDLLVRKRNTKSQTNLSVIQRMKNIGGAFGITQKRGSVLIPKMFKHAFGFNEDSPEVFLEGKRILLVDDVLTTGITTNECAGVLKEANVESVGVVTIARILH